MTDKEKIDAALEYISSAESSGDDLDEDRLRSILASTPKRRAIGGIIFEDAGVRPPKVGEWYLLPSGGRLPEGACVRRGELSVRDEIVLRPVGFADTVDVFTFGDFFESRELNPAGPSSTRDVADALQRECGVLRSVLELVYKEINDPPRYNDKGINLSGPLMKLIRDVVEDQDA